MSAWAPFRSGAGQNDSGLTLVEMLVVLVIIGIAAGAATLTIGSITRAPSVEAEARRLATMLQSAADDAMLGDRMVAFTIESHGYAFATVSDSGMQPMGGPFAMHYLPSGMTMTLSRRPPIVLGVEGAGQPVAATLENGQDQWVVTYDGLNASAAPAPRAAPQGQAARQEARAQ